MKSHEFLGIELRDNVGQDYVSQRNIKNGSIILLEKIKKKCWDELPDFIESYERTQAC